MTPDDWDEVTIQVLVAIAVIIGGVVLLFILGTLYFYFFE
jgi:hypothetical protein